MQEKVTGGMQDRATGGMQDLATGGKLCSHVWRLVGTQARSRSKSET